MPQFIHKTIIYKLILDEDIVGQAYNSGIHSINSPIFKLNNHSLKNCSSYSLLDTIFLFLQLYEQSKQENIRWIYSFIPCHNSFYYRPWFLRLKNSWLHQDLAASYCLHYCWLPVGN